MRHRATGARVEESERLESADHRRKRWLFVHCGLFAIVTLFNVGTWILMRFEPQAPIDRRATEGFWPGWLMVTWGSLLAVHALFVWFRRLAARHAGTGVWSGQSGRVVRTVLFTDIVGSTDRAVRMGDRRWSELLDRHDRLAASTVGRFGGAIVKHTGDGLLALFSTPRDAISCARDLRSGLEGEDLAIRAGVHTGEVEPRGQDVGGIGVHIASRVMAAAGASEIVVSRTVRDLLSGSGIVFADRGSHELKGLEGRWQLFSVE